METTPPFPDLYEYALAQTRLSAERRELSAVAVGAEVDYSWLTKFSLGQIPGASYHKVARVASYYMTRHPPPAAATGVSAA